MQTNNEILDMLTEAGHCVLVTSEDNPKFFEICANILQRSKEKGHFCFLETNELKEEDSKRIATNIFKHINPDLLDMVNTARIGDEDSMCGSGLEFSPIIFKDFLKNVQADMKKRNLKGFTSVHTSTYQFYKAIKNPDVFMIDGELLTTHTFQSIPNSLVLCSYRLKPHEFQDKHLAKLLAYHKVVVFLDEKGKLMCDEDAAMAILDRMGV